MPKVAIVTDTDASLARDVAARYDIQQCLSSDILGRNPHYKQK